MGKGLKQYWKLINNNSIMTEKKFKGIVNGVICGEFFEKKGKRFYIFSPEVIYVIGLQKSGFSNAYYFNVGYFIRELAMDVGMPKETDGHLRARMTFKDNLGKVIDYIAIDKLSEDDEMLIRNEIIANISRLIKGYLSIDGLKKLIDRNPFMLYQTTISAKSFLGYT